MSAKTSIEWTGRTWNPLVAYLTGDVEVIRKDGEKVKVPAGTRGWFCTKCSPGCAHCYAEKINLRLGNGLEYAVKNLSEIEFRLVNVADPMRWKKPRTVFVNSMTDLFHESVADSLIDRVFAAMAASPRHTFQVLTKRAKRMREYLSDPWRLENIYGIWHSVAGTSREVESWPLPNVWLGVSVENQKYANERIPELLATPAAVRFLSCEPLLGSVDLTRVAPYLLDGDQSNPGYTHAFSAKCYHPRTCILGPIASEEGIRWVICGGESGPGARPCNVSWIRDIAAQCKSACVPVFVKQLGAAPYDEAPYVEDDPHFSRWTLVHKDDSKRWVRYFHFIDRKGGNPSEWPEEFCTREMPEVAHG